MSQHIPAWKRIGLRVKEELQEDPLAITTHLEDANLTNKQAKKLNKEKRKLEESKSDDKRKKAPKRVKLSKSERPPPPEKDQLAYLRQYETDKSNWKFSKQKQNWILKNIRSIPKDYESALQNYLEGLQGGSRDRILNELRETINKWNGIAEEVEAKIEQELENQLKGGESREEKEKEETEQGKKEGSNEKPKNQKKQTQQTKDEAPDYDYAVRCRKLVRVLNDENLFLKGIDQPSNDNKDPELSETCSIKQEVPQETVDVSQSDIEERKPQNIKEIKEKDEVEMHNHRNEVGNQDEEILESRAQIQNEVKNIFDSELEGQENKEEDNLIIDEVEVSGLTSLSEKLDEKRNKSNKDKKKKKRSRSDVSQSNDTMDYHKKKSNKKTKHKN